MKTYKVIDIVSKAPNTFCLRVERPDYQIRAGQCFNVGIPGFDVNREYSMYSDANAPFLDFLIRHVEDGLVSQRLKKLKPNDHVEIDGPYGEFCLPSDWVNKEFVLIGSGTGIAPFHSFVKTYPSLNYKVIHGVRVLEECYDQQDYISGRYIPCLSRGEGALKYRVTDYISTNQQKKMLIFIYAAIEI
jgi:NAD(P)H-flavin reductase